MKIALIGYGKMGKAIENIAMLRGHQIVLKIDADNLEDFEKIGQAEVAIEFTRPESVVENLKKCINFGIPVVCGTTGWLSNFDEVAAFCLEKSGAFLYASNYSIGVNIFFEINRRLADMMNGYDMYNVKMAETHHTQKLDAPSGTAITLANDILKKMDRKTQWTSNTEGAAANEILITAQRIDPAPGTHVVTYESLIDTIEISHTAHSREGFATGAVLAAEWILGKEGVFSMKDMLGF